MSIEMWKSKKGRGESEKLFVMVERAILPFVLIKYARFMSQESIILHLNNLLENRKAQAPITCIITSRLSDINIY